ncbi:ABC transporter permease [Oceanivirga salmonicida]|uniref:ABC transporter permease n=1 Tax=Oceanivirga salmonicida TaxID=1769291 RepID=UPI00082EBE7C|nr:ABC transporter permease [Oceanivirga salmonicida]
MKNKVSSSKSIELKFDLIRTLLAIFISLIIAFIFIFIVSEEPYEAIKRFFIGPIMNKRNFGNVIELTIPLIFAGLSISVMFQANQFNMAAEGAFFLGGLSSSIIAVGIQLPFGIHPMIAILFGGIVGTFVCLIPAILKVVWNANEIVSSLMLNYIILYLGTYILQYYLLDTTAGYSATHKFLKSAKLPILLSKTRIHFGIIIALILVVVTYIFVYKNKYGYEIRILGQNINFAKYTGISVGGTIILSQIIGGFIAGIGGAIEVLGMYTRFSWVALPGYGFDGIIIAILSKNNPLFVPLAAFFLAYLRIGADIMSRRTDVAPEVVSIVQAMIILLIAAKMFLSKYKNRKIIENSQLKLKEGDK